MPSERPTEVSLAAECAAALEVGDALYAKALAEQGLELAKAAGDSKWQRRFEHLLRVACGTPIEGPPYEPAACSFCLKRGGNVTAGLSAFICDECVERCSEQQLAGSPIERVVAGDVSCSFCSHSRPNENLFAAQGYYICDECVQLSMETAGEDADGRGTSGCG